LRRCNEIRIVGSADARSAAETRPRGSWGLRHRSGAGTCAPLFVTRNPGAPSAGKVIEERDEQWLHTGIRGSGGWVRYSYMSLSCCWSASSRLLLGHGSSPRSNRGGLVTGTCRKSCRGGSADERGGSLPEGGPHQVRRRSLQSSNRRDGETRPASSIPVRLGCRFGGPASPVSSAASAQPTARSRRRVGGHAPRSRSRLRSRGVRVSSSCIRP
jgi:hypothetical protein